MGDSMSDGRIFDLRAQALRLISHTTTFETTDPLVSEGLGHFQSLQDSIRKSVQRLEDARIAAARPTPPPAPVTTQASFADSQEPARRSLPPGTRYETSQTQYAAALADQDVIQALLQLHDEAEIENRMARTRAPAKSTEQSLERAQPPKAEVVDFEQIQFSRTRQTSRGVFSPILKPPRRDPGRSD